MTDASPSTDPTTTPRVSIGLPVYNGANYLAETLDSILAQTLEDFELIICDNASTDETEAICRRYAEQDPRIRYRRHAKNLGACANYDMTFHLSRAPYFKWAAHDDVLAPTHLERCAEVLDADASCDLVYPMTVLIDHEGTEIACYVDSMYIDSDEPAARLAQWMLIDLQGLCNPVFGLMRRDAMEATALHGDYPQSDRVFLASMALGGRSRALHEGLFFCRLHDLNSTQAHTNARDLKSWYTGRRSWLPAFPRWRLLLEFSRAVMRAPLSRGQRLAAAKVVGSWARLNRRGLLRECVVVYHLNGQPTALARAVARRRSADHGRDRRRSLWRELVSSDEVDETQQ